MVKSRHGWKWTIRFWVGAKLNHLTNRVLDPHDDWIVEYRGKEDGRKYMQTISGFHNQARAFAREHKGKIVGSQVATFDEFGY